jgi:undecaprenyl diphosphate synthase
MSAATPAAVPRHIAIIMDGNGRWAQARGKIRTAGHHEGFKATRRTVEACAARGVEVLTLFAFSSENWRRPEEEVGVLMDLFLRGLKSEVSRLHQNRVRIRFIGERSAFSDKLRAQMDAAEAKTADNDGMVLAIAVNYGGRWDIVQAARKLAEQVAAGQLDPAEIDEARLHAETCLAELPEPDLFIRTGGEIRISNFLLWQLAYTELYFTDSLWPEFDADLLDAAIAHFNKRQRRFGRTGAQVEQSDA